MVCDVIVDVVVVDDDDDDGSDDVDDNEVYSDKSKVNRISIYVSI